MKSRCKSTRIVLFLSFICLLSTACNEGLYPVEVAEGFWRGVKDKNVKAIQKYSTVVSQEGTKPGENILPLDEITLGKTVIDGENAWVDTTVTISGDKPFTIPIRTILIRENKQWKVDYDETIKLISEGSSVSNVIKNIRDMSKELAEEFNQSMEDIQETIPEIKAEVEEIEESLLEHVPELKKQIEEFVNELKDAIKDLGKEPGESTATET